MTPIKTYLIKTIIDNMQPKECCDVLLSVISCRKYRSSLTDNEKAMITIFFVENAKHLTDSERMEVNTYLNGTWI